MNHCILIPAQCRAVNIFSNTRVVIVIGQRVRCILKYAYSVFTGMGRMAETNDSNQGAVQSKVTLTCIAAWTKAKTVQMYLHEYYTVYARENSLYI